ncbi:MAG: tRNA (guanosine(37)-N1)-methyltransferase TrmD [Candidatus Aureabacteria bacterium]|nr:tRNA (guanosine(37)-N1)-methyltransferase TrmD [Candidatus Auribacterota bacterium]MCK5161407.1 tRNA (guanosine(37)-N1)-methyltransferase TrmD [Candidatus Auribacterota bacterium]
MPRKNRLEIVILSLFPEMFEGPFSESIIKRAIDAGKVSIKIADIRDFTKDKHRTADDRPYGGGPGMVLKPEPIFEAVKKYRKKNSVIILTSASGKKYTQEDCEALSKKKHLIIICGHYEGVDERIAEGLADLEFSVGDYILTNGEIPAMIIADSVIRLLPGVLGHEDSNKDESFISGLLEYPHYTRPAEYLGKKVPDVLVSGNHKEIEKWRKARAIEKTKKNRKDLLRKTGIHKD